MTYAIFGVLTDTSFTYFKGERITEPYKAYPILMRSYNSQSNVQSLLNSYDATVTPIEKATKIDDMRYHLKQFFNRFDEAPDYGYVFNMNTKKWYVWDKSTNDWISLTKLEQYL